MYKITKEDIDINEIIKKVASERAGAIVTFLGVTRAIDEGDERRISYLDYDAYPEMAEEQMKKIGEEAKSKFKIAEVCVYHKIGRVNVGEASVGIAVSSPHREDGFLACKYIIDRIKEITPIWKKEVWEGGEQWKGKE